MPRWIITVLVGVYVLLRTLPLLMMTAYRARGDVPATAPTELADYFLHMPWAVIVVSWVAIATYIIATTLFAMRQTFAKRAFAAAIVLDLGAWIYARTATAYADVFTPMEQAVDAFAFLIVLVVIVLMILERNRGSMT